MLTSSSFLLFLCSLSPPPSEYSFGFHNSSDTGVFSMPPRQVPNAVFRESILVGSVYLTFDEFMAVLNKLKGEWAGNSYHLLKRNCNEFSKKLLAALGLKAPSFINRLAGAGDVLSSVIPRFLLPKGVAQLIKNGKPDMGEGEGEGEGEEGQQNELLRSVPSGRSGAPAAGVPTLNNNFGSTSSSRSQPQPQPPINPDALDDAAFEAFLRQSEMEFQREQEGKLARMLGTSAATTNPATASKHVTQPAQHVFTQHQHGKVGTAASSSSSHSRSSPSSSPLPLHLSDGASSLTEAERDRRVDAAIREFNLSPDVSPAELAQIRAVLKMSMEKGAR
jgi:hypothetical protein